MFDAHAFEIAANFPPASKFSTFGQLATIAIQFLIGVATALSVIFLVVGGIKIVTSSGDQKKVASAQSTIIYALIGLGVSIFALAIVAFLQRVLKSDIPIT